MSGTLVFKKILKFLLLTIKNFIIEPDISFNFKLFPRIVNINHSCFSTLTCLERMTESREMVLNFVSGILWRDNSNEPLQQYFYVVLPVSQHSTK